MSGEQLKKYRESVKAPPTLTTSNGAPIESLTASKTAGQRGPLLIQDFVFLDHLAQFDRERIPERVVHAKGAAAFGYFEVTRSEFQSYCKADLFNRVGKRTPVAVRFSTVGGENGSADTVRDPRGFAVKFYTDEGNWDMVGNNTPIFFIRDPILFPSFIHTQKRNPRTHLKDANMMWDFISLRPETTHQVSFLFSDRGIPDGYRHMNGYGSHTFKVVNHAGVGHYVKFHWKTDQGIRNLSVDEANTLASEDPDYSIRDLYNAIAAGQPPSWTLYVQLMTEAEAQSSPFNPFDLTKVWPHQLYPLQEVGRMVLDRNPMNYYAEVEQLAFSPAHMVPGVEPSPDKMLQGRLFSYVDTHRHRLGPNYQQIPVNKPLSAVRNYQRDSFMNGSNQGDAPNYFPNSFGGPNTISSAAQSSFPVSGMVARYETGDDDNFSQVRNFYNHVLSEEERDRLTSNIAGNLIDAEDFIQRRAISNFTSVDPDYGSRIARKIAALRSAKTSGAAVVDRIKQRRPNPLNPPRSKL